MSKSLVQKLIKQQKVDGNLQPKLREKPQFSHLTNAEIPDFNPIELWWSQLKSFLRSFAPTTTEMVDKLISLALELINHQHLRNWFASCCYCTS
ncbi:MAG: hypothetical protein V7K69_27350 [Nostoc sp.]